MPVLLILALLVFAYPFVIYPVLLRLVVRGAPEAEEGTGPGGYPSAALVICALNEGRVIRKKLENSLQLQYPGRLRIVLISDGSTDDTAAIAREFAPRGVELIEREQRRGKVANLNEVVPSLDVEVVVLSDANVIYREDALLRLVARFADPAVGCCSGKVVLTGTTGELSASECQYYSLEWDLQEKASRLYSMAGADGAMYALRRPLFRACPNDTIIEDLIVPIGVVRQGFRVVFEPRALAWESGVSSVAEEFRRKTRIAAGAAQAMLRGNVWPVGAPARFWWIFVSHKLLRWLSPFTGLAALALAVAAPRQFLSQAVLAGFALLAAAAAARWLSRRPHPLLDAPFYFLFGQVALLWGLLKGAAGRQSVLWAKANR